jgi:hypothetical protein
VDEVSKGVSQCRYEEICGTLFYDRLFILLGGKVVSDLMLNLTRERSVMIFVERIVSCAFEQQWLDRSLYESFRVQFLHQLGECLTAIEHDVLRQYLMLGKSLGQAELLGPLADMIPAIASVLGDTDMLLSHVAGPSDLLKQSSKLLPNALDTAVASGKTEVLMVILEYFKQNVKGKPEATKREELRVAAGGIGQGLRTAIRLCKKDAGMMIFKFLAENSVFGQSTERLLRDQLVRDAMEYGSLDLIHGAFIYQQRGRYDPALDEVLVWSTISEYEEIFLFEYASPGVLQARIKLRLFDPNRWHRCTSPLQFALNRRDHRRARILLEGGANVDALTTTRYGETALWIAADTGRAAAVHMLLEYGASPFRQCNNQSPLQIARLRRHRKCTYLLMKVQKHGKEVLKRPDLWDDYEKSAAHQGRCEDFRGHLNLGHPLLQQRPRCGTRLHRTHF